MIDIKLASSFLLHSRKYKETSLLLDVFTQEHGRLSMVAKGVRKKKGAFGILQAFTPLLISAKGRGQLLTLTGVELRAKPIILTSKPLLCGLYLNELLYKLLAVADADAVLFQNYAVAIQSLAHNNLEVVLRSFEKKLLKSIGYELPLNITGDTKELVEKDLYYKYNSEFGPYAAADVARDTSYIKGETLIDIYNDRFVDSTLYPAKKIMQKAISKLLTKKSLTSRLLFV